MRDLIMFVLVCAVIYGLYAVGTDPYRTTLPMEVADLTPIQPALDKLPPEDRELVTDYLKRSNGDVLPEQFADPDAPLTARTFAQAIALQKDFRVTMAAQDKEAAARRAVREAAMQSLRDVVGVRLVKRELLTRAEIFAMPSATGSVKRANPGSPNDPLIQVMTYRVSNRSARTVAAFSGSVKIPGKGLMPAADCWIDERASLEALASREVRCGNTNRGANDEEREAVTRPMSEITLVWNPAEVTFADGSVLKAQR